MYSIRMWVVHIHPLSLKSTLLNSTYYGIGTGNYIHIFYLTFLVQSLINSLPVQVSIRIVCFCIIY